MRLARRATPLLLPLALGCGTDPLALPAVQGTYVLEVRTDLPSVQYADTLVLGATRGASGAYGAEERIHTLERRAAAPAGAPPDSQVTYVVPLDYRLDAGALRFYDPVCRGTPCDTRPLYRGVLEGSVLTLVPRPESSISARRFRRVTPD